MQKIVRSDDIHRKMVSKKDGNLSHHAAQARLFFIIWKNSMDKDYYTRTWLHGNAH